MQLIKLFIVSLFCLLSLTCRVRGGKAENTALEQNNKKDTKITAAQSTIYKIKRLNPSKDEEKLQKQRMEEHQKQQQLQQQQQQYEQKSKQQDVMHHQESKGNYKATEGGDASTLNKHRTKKFRKTAKTAHGLNRKLLNKLGFTKVKAPNSHNRKRLAIESRRHASPDDSHMFIIKLPPNMYYYTNPKPSTSGAAASSSSLSPSSSSSSSLSSPNALVASADKKNSLILHGHKDDTSQAKDAKGKKVSFPFNSNGKPGRIYHWNLPVIRKMFDDKQLFPSVANIEPNKVDQMIDIKNIPTWSKPWENDSIEKSYNQDSIVSYKKSLKRKSPTYYAPASAVNKSSFNKYFSGNGKPKGFYVFKENQKKPMYYKNIVS